VERRMPAPLASLRGGMGKVDRSQRSAHAALYPEKTARRAIRPGGRDRILIRTRSPATGGDLRCDPVRSMRDANDRNRRTRTPGDRLLKKIRIGDPASRVLSSLEFAPAVRNKDAARAALPSC
jgi:hypothetical protein